MPELVQPPGTSRLFYGHYIVGGCFLNIVGTLGGGLGSIGAASYQDRHDTYLPVFYVFAILMLVSAVCSLLIKPIAQRVDAIGGANPADITD